MLRKGTWKRGAASVMLLLASGCASKPRLAAVECPRFVPSQEALRPIVGTGWKDLAQRVVEVYSSTSSSP